MWVAESEKLAFGLLNMSPQVFMSLTPGQFKRAVIGYGEGQKAQQRLLAWSICHIVNGTGNRKEPLTMEMLIPTKKPQKLDETPQETLIRLKERFGVK